MNLDGITFWTVAKTPDSVAVAVQDLADEVAQAARRMSEVFEGLQHHADRSTEYWSGEAAEHTRAHLRWVAKTCSPQLRFYERLTAGLRTFATQLPGVTAEARAILAELEDPSRNPHSLSITPDGRVTCSQMFFGEVSPEVQAQMAEADRAVVVLQERVNTVVDRAVEISNALRDLAVAPEWSTTWLDADPALGGQPLYQLDAEGRARADLASRTGQAPTDTPQAPQPDPQTVAMFLEAKQKKGPLGELLDRLTEIF